MNKCETCKFWIFPTDSVHQNLVTHGQCEKQNMLKTLPGDCCKEYAWILRSTKFGMLVGAAIRQKARLDFGKNMNSDVNLGVETELKELRNGIDEVIRNSTVNQPTEYQATPGEVFHIVSKQPLKFVMSKCLDDKKIAVMESADGSLHIFDNAVWEFRIPK